MEKNYYDAASLLATLKVLEEGYGMSSADFYRAHVNNDDAALVKIGGVHRQAWAGFYSEWRRMSGSSFASRIERDLQTV